RRRAIWQTHILAAARGRTGRSRKSEALTACLVFPSRSLRWGGFHGFVRNGCEVSADFKFTRAVQTVAVSCVRLPVGEMKRCRLWQGAQRGREFSFRPLIGQNRVRDGNQILDPLLIEFDLTLSQRRRHDPK